MWWQLHCCVLLPPISVLYILLPYQSIVFVDSLNSLPGGVADGSTLLLLVVALIEQTPKQWIRVDSPCVWTFHQMKTGRQKKEKKRKLFVLESVNPVSLSHTPTIINKVQPFSPPKSNCFVLLDSTAINQSTEHFIEYFYFKLVCTT